MRLNSALVVNIIKSILGSVFLEARCSAVGIRTGYIISVIRILIIEDVPNVRHGMLAKSCSRRTQKVVNECTTYFVRSGERTRR